MSLRMTGTVVYKFNITARELKLFKRALKIAIKVNEDGSSFQNDLIGLFEDIEKQTDDVKFAVMEHYNGKEGNK